MSRARLVLLVLLTSAIAACSASSPTAPSSSRSSRLRSQHDDNPPPCDSTAFSGYTNPNGHC